MTNRKPDADRRAVLAQELVDNANERLELDKPEYDYVKTSRQRLDIYRTETVVERILNYKNPALSVLDNLMAVVALLILVALAVASIGSLVYLVLHLSVYHWLAIGAVVLVVAVARGFKRLFEYIDTKVLDQ